MSEQLYAVALGVLQGLSEFLPISSSGHLIIVSWFLNGQPLPLSLNIALHLGTVLAVLMYFWRDWLNLGNGVKDYVFERKKSFESHILLPALVVGTFPAGIVGLLWEDQIERLFHNPLSVTIPLALVGFIIWQVDVRAPKHRSVTTLRVKDGLIVGFFQALALIPGVSRSGATIVGGRLLGLNRSDAAKFSFLLGTPAMAGAALLKIDELSAAITEPIFYIGIISSFFTGCLTIALFLKFLRRFGFLAFALYRLVLAVVIATLVMS